VKSIALRTLCIHSLIRIGIRIILLHPVEVIVTFACRSIKLAQVEYADLLRVGTEVGRYLFHKIAAFCEVVGILEDGCSEHAATTELGTSSANLAEPCVGTKYLQERLVPTRPSPRLLDSVDVLALRDGCAESIGRPVHVDCSHVVNQGMLTGKLECFVNNTGIRKDMPVSMEAVEVMLHLLERVRVVRRSPSQISEVEERRDTSNGVIWNISCDRREKYLHRLVR
jgi:hypothetical protein